MIEIGERRGLNTEFLLKCTGIAVFACTILGCSQKAPEQPSPSIPQTDSSYIDSNGAAHITRVVPVPTTISLEAQKLLARPMSDAEVHQTLAERRSSTDAWQARAGAAYRAAYPIKEITSDTIAGVPVKIITPTVIPPAKRDRVLINLHGGGFNSDSGSLSETIPIANLAQTKVVAVLYRLAPEHPFPAAVDDAVAVYKELLKTHKPRNVAIYGTSAGAILTAEVAVKLKQLGLPLPAALGVFSGMGDFTRLLAPPPSPPSVDPYAGSTSLTDPVLSPVFADLKGMPPTLFVTSGRDILLSGTTILHRKFLAAGDDARLVVFEGQTHAFWNNVSLPESKEADGIMAGFLDKELGK
jgi:acetyl esterase/lipase